MPKAPTELKTAPKEVAPPTLVDRPPEVTPADLADEVSILLAGMTYEERLRAYRSRALTPHELAVAAAWLPERMPTLNGELEWIAFNAE